jgi:cytochrome c peroxidase
MVHRKARAAFASALAFAASFTGCADVDAITADDRLAEEAVAVRAQALPNGRQCGNPNADRDTFQGSHVPNLHPFPNHAGLHATYSTQGGAVLDTNNPFFQSLGTNGRTCATCHTPEDGFSISAANVQKRFRNSCGLDPVFRPVDGANNPSADVSTYEAREAAYSLLLNKALIRIQEPIPAGAQFELVAVDDPYGNDLSQGLSVFRRSLPAMNLKFNAVIMWDGREPTLLSQALNATLRHAEASTTPSAAILQSIVDFQTSLFTTQVQARGLGTTSAEGVLGDPITLSTEVFFVNINRDTSTFPPAPTEKTLGPDVFKVFAPWASSSSPKRASVARGEALFNRREFFDPVGGPDTTCAECHNAPNAGSFSGPMEAIPPFGGMRTVLIADAPFRTPDLPLYTLRNKITGEIRQTTDPGIAFTTGLWRDVSRFKAPHLRGLASRAPYFHNGMAATLEDVVEHYNTIDNIGLTADEKADLVAFLAAL